VLRRRCALQQDEQKALGVLVPVSDGLPDDPDRFACPAGPGEDDGEIVGRLMVSRCSCAAQDLFQLLMPSLSPEHSGKTGQRFLVARFGGTPEGLLCFSVMTGVR
jgi:hypothetical protein